MSETSPYNDYAPRGRLIVLRSSYSVILDRTEVVVNHSPTGRRFRVERPGQIDTPMRIGDDLILDSSRDTVVALDRRGEEVA